MKTSFKTIVDRRLQALSWDGKTDEAMERLHARLAQTPKQPRRRIRRSTMIALGFAAVLLTATAFAVVELIFSNDYTVEKAAREAVVEKYGLTARTLTLFWSYTAETEDETTVLLTSDGLSKAGYYTVTVPKHGKPEAVWSQDGKDPALWESAGLEAPVWGERQLEAYMDARAQAVTVQDQLKLDFQVNRNTLPLAERASWDAAIEAVSPNKGRQRVNAVPGAEAITEKEAVALADKALEETFEVTPEQMEAMGFLRNVWFTQNQETGEATYDVRWDSENGKVLLISMNAKGGDQLYSTSFFPNGKLPQGSLEHSPQAVDDFIQQGGLDSLTAEERADAESRIRAAGMGELLDALTKPVQTEAEASATQTATAALQDAYGLSNKMLGLFASHIAADQREGKAVWNVALEPALYGAPYYGDFNSNPDTSPLGVYTAVVDSESGVALSTDWSLEDGTKAANSEGAAATAADGAAASPAAKATETTPWTASTWGQAKAYDAAILPWFIDLCEKRAAIIAPYAEDERWPLSPADSAAEDQLFRDAGFDSKRYNHVMPETGDITEEAAWDLFASALNKEYGISRQTMEESAVAYAELTQEPEGRQWYFWIQNSAEQTGWSIVIDAKTGEIINLVAESFAAGNG